MRTDRAIRVAMLAVLAAVVLYIGYSLFESRTDPLQTVLAVEHTVDSTYEVEGWILREETVLSGYGEDVSVQAAEGEKLGAGQHFALRYTAPETLALVSELEGLQQEQAQIQQVLAGTGGETDSAANAARQLAAAVARRQFASLDALELAASAYVLGTGGDPAVLEASLTEIDARIRELEALVAEQIIWLDTPSAGIYSSMTDGYEHLTPGNIRGLTPDGLRQYMSGGRVTRTDAIGKLVDGGRWYFAAVLEAQVAQSLVGREEIAAEFPRYFEGEVRLTPQWVGDAVDGKCVVLFSSVEKLTAMLSARQAQGSLILRSCSGIRLPKEAVWQDDSGSQRFVYILEGLQARRVNVTVLEEYGKFYYIQTGEELRRGMEVISQARGLYDGKVVQ